MSEAAKISIAEQNSPDKTQESFHTDKTSPSSDSIGFQRTASDAADADQIAIGGVQKALNEIQNPDAPKPQKTEKFSFFSNFEKLKDHEYSQVELLDLVKKAEAKEAAISEGGKPEKETPFPAANMTTSNEVQTFPSFDQQASNQEIERIEDQILDYEKKAKNGDKNAKRELGILMVEQWQLLGKIYKQRQADQSSAHHGTNKPASIRRGLFPSIVRLYKKMNGPENNELNFLRSVVTVKEAKAGIRTGLRTWQTPKGTASELAARITKLQYR